MQFMVRTEDGHIMGISCSPNHIWIYMEHPESYIHTHIQSYTYRYVHIICIYQVYRGCKLLSSSRAWLWTGSTVLSVVVPIVDCNDPVSTSQESSRTPLYLNQSGKYMLFYQPDSCRHLGMIPLYIHHDGSEVTTWSHKFIYLIYHPHKKDTHTHTYIYMYMYIYIL